MYGVSHHSGSLYGGHYVAEVRDLTSGKWFKCDDSYVSPCSNPDLNSSSAYVLFYRRNS